MGDRKSILTHEINLKGTGLEIGPLCWPILTKQEADIYYVDHASTATLRRLYKGDGGVPPDQIVEVDFPLRGRSLEATVKGTRFDYVLASHVIEHVPDMIAWLNDMAGVLKPGGILSLAIPDKRFTFDIDRNSSRPADVIGAYLDKLKKPNSITVYDYFRNYRSKVDPHQAWAGQLYTTEEAGPHRYTAQDAMRYAEVNRDTKQYVDTHCFVFTPSSFIAILRELMELSLVPFEVAAFHETPKNVYEFYVSLRKVPARRKRTDIIRTLPDVHPEASVRTLQAQISKLEGELSATAHDLEHIRNSVSWKVTAPIRTVRKHLARLLR